MAGKTAAKAASTIRAEDFANIAHRFRRETRGEQMLSQSSGYQDHQDLEGANSLKAIFSFLIMLKERQHPAFLRRVFFQGNGPGQTKDKKIKRAETIGFRPDITRITCPSS